MDTRKYFSRLGFAFLIGTAVLYGLEIVIQLAVNFIIPDLVYSNYELYFIIQMLSMYAISMPAMALIIIKLVPAKPVMAKEKMGVGRWLKILLIVYAGMYLSNLLGTMATSAIGNLTGHPVSNDIFEVATSNSLLTNFIIMVLIAPCFEEFLFRKLLVDRTIPYGDGISILTSGLFFGLFHGNLNQFVYAFTIGCVFAYVYIHTGKLRYTILMHMFVNFLGGIVSTELLELSGMNSILTQATITSEEIENIILSHIGGILLFVVYILLIIIFVILGIILFLLNVKKIHLNKTELSVEKGRRFITYFLNPGMIAFVLFWIGKIILQLGS